MEKAGWALDRAFADVSPDPDGLLKLHVDVAMQGRHGRFARFAYQVFVQTFGTIVQVVEQRPSPPITVSNVPVPFSLSITLLPNFGGRVVINKTFVDNQPIDLGLPSHIDIPPGSAPVDISGSVPPHAIFPFPAQRNVDIVFATAGGVTTYQLAINQV